LSCTVVPAMSKTTNLIGDILINFCDDIESTVNNWHAIIEIIIIF
jgi:hypothetical protein